MGKPAAPAAFIKPPKKTKPKTRKPKSPLHSAAEGFVDNDMVSQPSGVTHRPVPGICDHTVIPDTAKAHDVVQALFSGYRQPDSGGHIGLAALRAFKHTAESAAVPTGGGNPAGTPDYAAMRARTQPLGREDGHASLSSGNHAQGHNPGVSVGNPDLIQHDANARGSFPQLNTVRGDLMGTYGPTLGGFSHPGQVQLDRMPVPDQFVDHNPGRPAGHPARTSATPDRGGYPTGQVAAASTPPMSAKFSDRLAMMKALQG